MRLIIDVEGGTVTHTACYDNKATPPKAAKDNQDTEQQRINKLTDTLRHTFLVLAGCAKSKCQLDALKEAAKVLTAEDKREGRDAGKIAADNMRALDLAKVVDATDTTRLKEVFRAYKTGGPIPYKDEAILQLLKHVENLESRLQEVELPKYIDTGTAMGGRKTMKLVVLTP